MKKDNKKECTAERNEAYVSKGSTRQCIRAVSSALTYCCVGCDVDM